MPTRRAIVGSVIGASALAAAYLAFKQRTSSSDSMSVRLRLAWLPGATFAGDYVARKNGYWKQQGLSVAVEPGGFEFDAIKLVVSGQDQIGVTSGPQLLEARRAGVPLVALGATLPRSPIGWVTKSDSGITEPKHFSGKRVGAQVGTHTEITFEALMRKIGVPLDKVERIPVKFDPRPFVGGAVDVFPVYLIDQPHDFAAQGIKVNLINPWDYGVGLHYGNVYFTTEEFLTKNRDTVVKFLAGASEGWKWVNSNRTAAVDVLIENGAPSGKDVLKAKLDATLDFAIGGATSYPGVFGMQAAALSDTLELMRQYGNFKGDLSVEKFIFPTK